VSVNDVLGKPAGVDIDDLFPNSHVGAAPDADGGTLVYNPRETIVAGTDELNDVIKSKNNAEFTRKGPLHDPTAIIYVNTDDLVAKYPGGSGKGPNFVPDDPYCWRMEKKASVQRAAGGRCPGRAAGHPCQRRRLHRSYLA
jgi:hypothetical protein